MPNLLLTTECNRSCSYCFARGELKSRDTIQHITLDSVDWLVAFLHHGGARHISLLGGEPTLHPLFTEVFGRVWKAGFTVFLFTNGLMDEDTLGFLERADPDGLIIVVNVNHPRTTSPREKQRVRQVLQRLGQKAMAGFNITTPNVDLSFLIELVDTTRIARYIRLGLAHPIAEGGCNTAMTLDSIQAVGPSIAGFAQTCHARDIKLTLDCGFLRCMFSEEEHRRLGQYDAQLNFGCQPAIDIGPDLDVWRCFPLYRVHRKNLREFRSYQDAVKHFDDNLSWLSAHGCLAACLACPHLEAGRCAGGCMSHKLAALSR